MKGQFALKPEGGRHLITWMISSNRNQGFWDYVTGGIACGLGGMVLFSLPVVVVTVSWAWSHDWLQRHGFSDPSAATWIWGQITKLFGPMQFNFLFLVVLFGLPVSGFVYGWWAGMHRTRDPHAAVVALPRRRAAAT